MGYVIAFRKGYDTNESLRAVVGLDVNYREAHGMIHDVDKAFLFDVQTSGYTYNYESEFEDLSLALKVWIAVKVSILRFLANITSFLDKKTGL